jgi:microcystin degradation protein MlrC
MHNQLELAGMFQAIQEGRGKIIPACSMNSQSGGRVDQKVLDLFLEKTISAIKQNMPVDGVFLSLHGATQTTELNDACGEILEMVRKEAGGSAVIAVSADLHANVTSGWIRNADFICGYRSYPHVDHFETGYRAARLGMRGVQGGKFHMVRVPIPMIIPASSYNSLSGPFKDVIDEAKELVQIGELSDCSIFQMQPWLDVDPASGAVILTIDPDHEKAKFYALKLAKQLYDMRKLFNSELYTIDQVIDQALENQSGKPVVLVDFADSANAGSTGDSSAILMKLLERKLKPKTAMIVNDPDAVELAFKVGIGSKAEFSIGGTKNPNLFKPVRAEAYVRSLHDGLFCLEGPAGRGMLNDIGRTAVVNIGDIDIVICNWMVFAGDPQIYRGFGVEPTFYQMVVVKASTSFREAYHPISEKLYLTDTPGAASANLKSLPYQKVPDSFYPFSALDDYQIKIP